MRIRTGHSFRRQQALGGLRFVALNLGLAAAVWIGGSSGAMAQSWFDNLFQPFPQQQPQYYRQEPYRPAAPRPRPHPKPRPVVARPVEKPAVAASYFVAVIGDSLGQLLGQGLTEAVADQPDIGILRKARENTGLVRDDYYDWVKEARALLDSGEKIDVAVVLIGSNDRQAIHDGGATEELLSPKWKDIYAARVKALASLFRERKIPLIWVGLPIMKSDRFSADMSGFNDIYREQAAAAGATFVDIWEAFEDDKGQYSPFGPNIDGQIVRIRAADGVNFTKAGARKLAHFVEADVHRLLDRRGADSPAEADAKPGTVAPGTVAPATRDAVAPPVEAAPIPVPAPAPVAGPVLSLTSPAVAPDGVLASKADVGASPDAAASLIQRALVQGKPVSAKPGRADDYRWPQP